MAESNLRDRIGSSIGVVFDAPTADRLAERLGRAGAAAVAVPPESLEATLQPGRLYLAPLSLAEQALGASQRGAHLCLIPPWPLAPIMLGTSTVALAEPVRRGSVRYARALVEAVTPGSSDDAPLKILYRERLQGELGVVLAESGAGEPLLATLPRASNRNGYLLLTSLQLAVPSAQTRAEDIARLVTRVYQWCATHAEPVPVAASSTSSASAGAGTLEEEVLGEEPARILLLALALDQRRTAHASAVEPSYPVRQAALHADFERLCATLGQSAEEAAFAQGWAWLQAHGVIDAGTEERVNVAAIERYVVLWQLGPRLRRLR